MSTQSLPGCALAASMAGYILNGEERAMFLQMSQPWASPGHWEDTGRTLAAGGNGCREELRC